MIIFSVIYLLFLCAYFVTRVGNNLKYRAINKYILASMYLVYAIVMFFVHDLSWNYYIMLIALFFAYFGDIFLVFDFNKGGTSFMIGNALFAIFYIVTLIKCSIPFLYYFWIFIVWAAIVSLFIYLSKKYPNIIKLGKLRKPMTFYLSSITLHGLMGLVTAIFVGCTPLVVMGIGSVLFLVSDCILTIDRFVIQKNKWIVRANSLTYFVGMLLIVLSLGL